MMPASKSASACRRASDGLLFVSRTRSSTRRLEIPRPLLSSLAASSTPRSVRLPNSAFAPVSGRSTPIFTVLPDSSGTDRMRQRRNLRASGKNHRNRRGEQQTDPFFHIETPMTFFRTGVSVIRSASHSFSSSTPRMPSAINSGSPGMMPRSVLRINCTKCRTSGSRSGVFSISASAFVAFSPLKK